MYTNNIYAVEIYYVFDKINKDIVNLKQTASLFP